MGLIVLTGAATNVTLGSDYSYAATANHGPVAIKNQLVSMRLNNRPVLFRTRTLPSISDGDQIAAAGNDKGGTLEAVALRNVTTGVIYHPPTTVVIILAAALVVLGIPLIAFLGFGLLFIGVGAWAIHRALQVRKAVRMLSVEQVAAMPQP